MVPTKCKPDGTNPMLRIHPQLRATVQNVQQRPQTVKYGNAIKSLRVYKLPTIRGRNAVCNCIGCPQMAALSAQETAGLELRLSCLCLANHLHQALLSDVRY